MTEKELAKIIREDRQRAIDITYGKPVKPVGIYEVVKQIKDGLRGDSPQ